MSAPTYTRARGRSNVPEELEKLVKQGRQARSVFERDMYLNLEFYKGNQWVWWNMGRVERPDVRTLGANRVLLVDNRINPIIRKEVAKQTKQRPIPVGVPLNGDEENVNAAKLGEDIFTYLWLPEQLGMQRKLFSVLNWSRICGAGFWKIFLDDTAGDSFDAWVGPDGAPMTDANGRPQTGDLPSQLSEMGVTAKKVYQGECAVEVRSPFEIIPDPLAENLDEAEWIIEESVRSKEYLLRRYADVPGIETVQEDTTAEATLGGVQGKGVDGYKGIRVFEYWARPSSEFPHGKRCVWVKDKYLEEDPEPFDAMPYVMFRGVDVPGQFWPDGIAKYLRGPQTELNKALSQIAENANRFGNPALLKSKMANVTYTGVPGEIIEFDDITQNAVPSYLQPPEIPGYVQQRVDRAIDSLREISSQHEVSSGVVPPGVTAASAINLLQEQDDTVLGPSTAEMEIAIGEAGTKLLQLVAQFYTDARTLRIAGKEDAWKIEDFRGAMLKGNTKVNIQPGSMLPKSQAAKQAAMQELLTLFLQNGMPMDKRQLAQYLQDMQVGGAERFIEQYTANETQINRENRRLSQGEMLDINSYDDDEAHISGHEEYQKTSKYELLPQVAHGAMEEHARRHRERMQQMMQLAQPQLPGMPQGQPPPQQPALNGQGGQQ